MEIRQSLVGLGAGLLFGAGLAVSGMMDPGRVIGFLDVARLAGSGIWDPTLGFVMAGALSITLPGFAFLRRQPQPGIAARFEWPTRRDVDGRLISGALLFGAGWGLVGFCPGPALAALSSGLGETALFAGAMLVGMVLFRLTLGAPNR